MRDKIRIELSSESRLGWEPFYAVLDLPATAQQIRDARQKARITGREDMTYQSVTMVEFEPLPNLEHIRLDTTSVEELNYLAQRLDSLSDEQFNKAAALGLKDGHLYKMAGNSVSVPVISAIGQKIKAANEKYEIVR